MNDEYKDYFLRAAPDWICDPYVAVISYIARKTGDNLHLLAGSLNLHPYPLAQDVSFTVETPEILAGVTQLAEGKDRLLELIREAAAGCVSANDRKFLLQSGGPYSYFSEFVTRDRWYDGLNLRVVSSSSGAPSSPSHVARCITDNGLRCASPPFDGLADLFAWIGLINPEDRGSQPEISLHIAPPIDFDPLPEAGLRNGRLGLSLTAHAKFDLTTFSLAIRPSPGMGVQSRQHWAHQVTWDTPDANKRDGKLEVDLDNADNVEVMLAIKDTTVRRQWMLDPTKAENYRLLAMQHFDLNLRKVKEALESGDGRRFEIGVGALLFLMGFSSAIQPETDAPDIVVSTLRGRIVLVECTTRIADFHEKLGKLVDRKAALTKIMQDRMIAPHVIGVLVCGQPKDHIAADLDELRGYQIPLVTREDLDTALERVRFHVDPDVVIDEALANLNRPDWVRP